MKMFFAILLAVLASAATATAQNQGGSEEIARVIEPAVNDALPNFAKCVVTLVKDAGVSSKEAQESCKDVSKRATRMAEGMANSAQKAARSIIVGGGFGGCGFGGCGGTAAIIANQGGFFFQPGGSRVTSTGQGGVNTTFTTGR